MANISDFKRGQIVDARIVGACVIKTVELFGEASSTVWKVMTTFEKEGKPLHWSKTLEESESCLIGTVGLLLGKDHKNTAPKITEELKDHLENPISSKTVRRELRKVELQSENHFKINIFGITRYFHYFAQPLYM